MSMRPKSLHDAVYHGIAAGLACDLWRSLNLSQARRHTPTHEQTWPILNEILTLRCPDGTVYRSDYLSTEQAARLRSRLNAVGITVLDGPEAPFTLDQIADRPDVEERVARRVLQALAIYNGDIPSWDQASGDLRDMAKFVAVQAAEALAIEMGPAPKKTDLMEEAPENVAPGP